jgi:DNA-binding response OmpR family regulator|tara:strand:+ start:408 stop:1073 length:666 start_codon:yes stop_codon:yes gene_type:complete
MTTVLLIGLQDHEAVPLEAAIGNSGLDLAPIRLSEVRIPDGIDARRSVAVLPGAADFELNERVNTAIGLALPVLVILPDFDTCDLDVSVGNIDFYFPPFRAEEFAVRIALLIARSGGNDSANVVQQGEIRIDLERYEVTVSGRKVDLTFKEYELLRVLASNPGHVYSREALLQTVWAYDYYGGTRTVDVHIRRLRSKINDVEHRFIETVWNVGYRFRTDND